MQKKNSKCFKRLFYSIILKCRYYILKKNLLEAVLSILVCPLPGLTYFLSVAPDDWTNGHCPVLPAAHMTPCHQLLRKLWQSPAEGGGVCGNQQDPGLESVLGGGYRHCGLLRGSAGHCGVRLQAWVCGRGPGPGT